MTNIEASKLEKDIVTRTGVLDAVVLLMSSSGSLWHDLMHGVDSNITDEKIRDKISRSKSILSGGGHHNKKNSKYQALKRVADFFNILADVFKAIEDSVDGRPE
jgi:hypothetical protein